MRAEDFDVQRLIESLNGTCNALEPTLIEFYPDMSEVDLTEEDWIYIDNEIFLCDTCGWWCEISEQCNDTPECGGSDCVDCCEPSHDEIE